MTNEQLANGEVRAVIFDYGGVLMRTIDPTPRRELERRLGLPPGGATKLVFESLLWNEVQLGRVSSAEFWADVGQRAELSAEGLAKFRRTFWAGDRLDEELVALIRHLRDEGYRTALLSNAPTSLPQHLERLGIADAFEVVVVSGCEGLMKPDPAIFHLTLERLGVEPQQAVFVDDMVHNVDAARELGIHTVQFVDLATSLAELEALLGHPIQISKPGIGGKCYDI
ncbi:MAG: HAD family hydrolase [Anaerolineae bacterium]